LCWREENLGFLLSLAMLDVLAIVSFISRYDLFATPGFTPGAYCVHLLRSLATISPPPSPVAGRRNLIRAR
jgi:hypothetical protein